MDFALLAQQCAADVHPRTMAAVASVESAFNPYAIGVVGGRLERQPSTKAEATATAQALERAGWNFSVGVAQVNRHNLARYGLDYEAAFDACRNLRAAAQILTDCFNRATVRDSDRQVALRAALSCYYSGNFTRGFRPDGGGTSYVDRVMTHAARQARPAEDSTTERPNSRQSHAPVQMSGERP
jgi:type IV secretion system protein VirB1